MFSPAGWVIHSDSFLDGGFWKMTLAAYGIILPTQHQNLMILRGVEVGRSYRKQLGFLCSMPDPCLQQKAMRVSLHEPGCLVFLSHWQCPSSALSYVDASNEKLIFGTYLIIGFYSFHTLSSVLLPALYPSFFFLSFFLWCVFLALTGGMQWQCWRLKSSIYTQNKHKIGKRLRKLVWTMHPKILWP